MSHSAETTLDAKRLFWADTPARTTRRGHLWIAGERVVRDGLTY